MKIKHFTSASEEKNNVLSMAQYARFRSICIDALEAFEQIDEDKLNETLDDDVFYDSILFAFHEAGVCITLMYDEHTTRLNVSLKETPFKICDVRFNYENREICFDVPVGSVEDESYYSKSMITRIFEDNLVSYCKDKEYFYITVKMHAFEELIS